MFLNCYGDWTPVKWATLAVRDIVTPMMPYGIMFHLVSVYTCIRLHSASLSVVLVFEAEQSYSRYRLMGLRENYAYRNNILMLVLALRYTILGTFRKY